MISAKALCEAFQQALSEEWGYIWGTRGQVWTQKQQDNATREILGTMYRRNENAVTQSYKIV